MNAMDIQEPWLNSCLPTGSQERDPDIESPSQTYAPLKPACPALQPMEATSADVLNLGEQKDSVVKTLRPHSTPATLMWLEENYEIADGICIPRSTLYMHYVDFCDRNGMQPVNAASFGKIIRQQFPQLTTRRLGTRGQSRYHYYGIAVRETSPYYDVTFSKKGINNAGDVKKEVIKQASPYTQRSRLASLLPEFPNVKDLYLPSSVAEDKVATFVMMYRTHCQRVMDTVIRASFDEVQSFLLHFWQGMPSHITSVLGTNVIINIVGVCDSILYRAISNVLLPSILQPLPDSLTQVIRKFSKDLESWVKVALEDLPENLVAVKFDLARRFSQMLRRQTSLNHLCQASRMVLHNVDITSQMLQDWRNIDQDSICRQTLYTIMDHSYNCYTLDLITNLYKEFETLLEEQSTIEAYVDWLETMVDRCVVQPSRKHKMSTRRLARQFLLMWSSFGTRVIRDMTLHSAPSFGSFHLLHLTFDDFVLYLVEALYAEERMRELYSNIASDTTPSFPEAEETFGDPDGNLNKIKWYNLPVTNPSEHLSSMVQTTTPNSVSEVINSPASNSQDVSESNGMRENCPIGEDSVASVSSPGDGNGQLMTEYSTGNDHFGSTMYTYGGYDSRNGYRHGTGSRSYPYPSNQYAMTSHSDGQQVDLTTNREGHVRGTEPSIMNGAEYSNTYVSSYPSTPRRGEYTNYSVYEPNSTSVIYPTPANCYYQSYDSGTGYHGNRYRIKEDVRATKEERTDQSQDQEDKLTHGNSTISPYNVAANSYVRV